MIIIANVYWALNICQALWVEGPQCIYLFTISSLQGNTERLSNFPKWSRNCQLPSLQMRKLLLLMSCFYLSIYFLFLYFFKLWLPRNFRTRILIIHYFYIICILSILNCFILFWMHISYNHIDSILHLKNFGTTILLNPNLLF